MTQYPEYKRAAIVGTLAAAFVLITSCQKSPTTPPKPYQQTIIDSTFIVDPRNFTTYPFTISGGYARLKGNIRAKGGQNDINVYILNEDGFRKFNNGESATTYFSRQKISNENLDVQLPANIYYIVFDNRHAELTSKTVTVNLFLEWY